VSITLPFLFFALFYRERFLLSRGEQQIIDRTELNTYAQKLDKNGKLSKNACLSFKAGKGYRDGYQKIRWRAQ
jgi:hypothetical protein